MFIHLLWIWLVLTLLIFATLVRITLRLILEMSSNPFRNPPKDELAGQTVARLLIISMIVAAGTVELLLQILE